jgi:hypothetical protein
MTEDKIKGGTEEGAPFGSFREGICGAEFGQHGIICELTFGHRSAWHEAPNDPGLPPLRWKPSTEPFNLSGYFNAAGDVSAAHGRRRPSTGEVPHGE